MSTLLSVRVQVGEHFFGPTVEPDRAYVVVDPAHGHLLEPDDKSDGLHEARAKDGGPIGEPAEAPEESVPAVSVCKSLASRDHMIWRVDGRPYKTLKRHLARHGLTPAQYRERSNMKPDDPIVASAIRIIAARPPIRSVSGARDAARSHLPHSRAAPKAPRGRRRAAVATEA